MQTERETQEDEEQEEIEIRFRETQYSRKEEWVRFIGDCEGKWKEIWGGSGGRKLVGDRSL